MALYERLISSGETDKIPVHQFMAAMAELERGEMTRAEVIAAWNLTTADITDLDLLITKYQSLPALEQFKFPMVIHDTLLLAEEGIRYTNRTDFINRVQRA